MERKIYNELLKWKRESSKPMLLYGNKQIGKTYSVLDFGKKNFKNIAYFNTVNNKDLIDILKKEKVLDKMIAKLSVLSGESIFKNDTLIVLDNIVEPNIVKVMKSFGTDTNEYKIIMITSKKDQLSKFKYEEIYFKSMYSMDFEEFLVNGDKKQLVDFIKQSYTNNTSMPFHQIATDLYNDYLITGGYPEVVECYFNKNDYLLVEAIKQKINDAIRSETIDANNLIDVIRCNEVLDSIPYQLKKDNKKFQYGCIKLGRRQKDYLNSLKYLSLNGLVTRSFKLNDVKSPLSSYKDVESFKIYLNDVGLLYSMMHLSRIRFLTDNNLRKSLIENNVANTLVNMGYSLYYYQSDGKAEISFIIQNRNGDIIPIEIVNMNLSKAKALTVFMQKYKVSNPIRLTEDNFSKKKNIKCIPVYAAFCLKDL